MASRIPNSPQPVFPVDSTRSRRSSESGASSPIVQSEDSSDEAKILQAKSTEQKIADDLGQKIPHLGDKGKERDVSSSSSSADDEIIEMAPQTPSTKNVSSSTTTTVATIVAAPPGAAPAPPGPVMAPVPPQQGGAFFPYRGFGGTFAVIGAGSGISLIAYGVLNSDAVFAGVSGALSITVGLAGLGYCFYPEISRLRVWTGHADPT